MSKVFILSDPYTTRTMVVSRELLFNMHVEKIIVHRECFDGYDKSIDSATVKVEVLQDLVDCLSLCDSVIVDTDFVSPDTAKMIENYMIAHSKKYHEFNLRAQVENNICIEMAKTPCILVLAIGQFVQHTYVELLFSKMLCDLGVRHRAIYTPQTTQFLNLIYRANYLDNDFGDQQSAELSPEVISYGIQIGDVHELERELLHIREISPDFVVVVSNNDFCEISFVDQFLRFACSSKMDMCVYSHYHFLDDDHVIYCPGVAPINNSAIDLEDPSMYEMLKTCMLQKLAFPKGIVPIN